MNTLSTVNHRALCHHAAINTYNRVGNLNFGTTNKMLK